jgi:hypothetical protein
MTSDQIAQIVLAHNGPRALATHSEKWPKYSKYSGTLTFENLCQVGSKARLCPKWPICPKVAYVASLYSKYTGTLTFENLCQANEVRRAALDGTQV